MIVFEIIIYALVLLGFIGYGILTYRKEKCDWNNEVCPKYGGDTKGYMCESCCSHRVWFVFFKLKEHE